MCFDCSHAPISGTRTEFNVTPVRQRITLKLLCPDTCWVKVKTAHFKVEQENSVQAKLNCVETNENFETATTKLQFRKRFHKMHKP